MGENSLDEAFSTSFSRRSRAEGFLDCLAWGVDRRPMLTPRPGSPLQGSPPKGGACKLARVH